MNPLSSPVKTLPLKYRIYISLGIVWPVYIIDLSTRVKFRKHGMYVRSKGAIFGRIDADEAFFIALFVSILVFLFITLASLALSQKHEGWRRLSIIFAGSGGLIGLYFSYGHFFKRRRRVQLEELFDIDFFGQAIIGIVIGVFAGLLIFYAVKWCKEGFSNAPSND